MMRHSLFLLPMMISLATPAFADPRITSRYYEASDVVVLHGHAGIQSTISFAPGERIENIAVGDSAAWQVMPNKRADLLFVKPSGPDARTNMTVVTDQRTYLFDLVSGRSEPVYMLRFTYPAPPKPPTPVVAAEPAPSAPAPPQSTEPDPASLNFAWEMHGERQLLPSRLFDDGHSTYLVWPKDVALPAILLRETTGAEGPVNYTVKGDYIIVEGVPAQLVLRSGKQMATLTVRPHRPTLGDDVDPSPPAKRQNQQTVGPVRAAIRPGPPYATFTSNQP